MFIAKVSHVLRTLPFSRGIPRIGCKLQQPSLFCDLNGYDRNVKPSSLLADLIRQTPVATTWLATAFFLQVPLQRTIAMLYLQEHDLHTHWSQTLLLSAGETMEIEPGWRIKITWSALLVR